MKIQIGFDTKNIFFDDYLPLEDHEIFRIYDEIQDFQKVFTDIANKHLPKKYHAEKFSDLTQIFEQMKNDGKKEGGR